MNIKVIDQSHTYEAINFWWDKDNKVAGVEDWATEEHEPIYEFDKNDWGEDCITEVYCDVCGQLTEEEETEFMDSYDWDSHYLGGRDEPDRSEQWDE